jgi:uncharacterized membrane-anchored protein
MAQEIRDVVFNIQVRTEDGAVKIEGLTKGFVKAESAFKKMQTTLGQTNKAINQAGISTGLANTAVLEFGRTISDAPYGIQGMGNNISQLVTILGQMSQSAKEGESVLKALRTALVGPLGVVIAVQVAVAALELFTRSQRKANKEVQDFNESIFLQTQALDFLQKQLDQTNGNEEERLRILKVLALANKDYRKILEDDNLTTAEKIYKGEVLLTQQRALNSANESLAKSYAIVKENIDKGTISTEKYQKAKKDLEITTQSVVSFGTQEAKVYDDTQVSTRNASQAIVDLYEARQNLLIQSELIINLEKAKKNLFEEGKPFVDGSTDAIKAQIKELENQRDALATTTKQIDHYNDRIEALQAKLAELLGTEDPREKVEELVLKTYEIAIVEAEKRRKEIEKKFKSLGLDIPSLILGGEEGKKALGEGILGLVDGLEDTGTAERFKDIVRNAVFPEDILQGAVDISQIANDLLQSESDRSLAIEQNKTNALNDQLKQRLANEQLSAEERDKINQQISRNEMALVQRSNEINKKRFQQEKAFSIAQATINTYLAASDVLYREKGGLAAKIIGMTVVIASGLAQVAAISRQQFTGQALPRPRLVAQGGGPAESQSPAFNIVGASGQSQLAQLISGQTGQPIKAYVVAGEVTTAQSLERNKIAEASI